MKNLHFLSGLIASLLLPFTLGAEDSESRDIDTENAMEEGLYAKFTTNRGTILLELHYDKVPMTVMNFVGLAEGKIRADHRPGEPFYDGLTFHRVIDNFMIQGGCPEGSGRGGPGYRFPDEIAHSLRHDSAGILSMANAGPNTNGSQFFITHGPTPHLDGGHAVFGRVVEGQDVVDAIRRDDVLEKVKILRVGDDAEAFQTDQESFDRLVAENR